MSFPRASTRRNRRKTPSSLAEVRELVELVAAQLRDLEGGVLLTVRTGRLGDYEYVVKIEKVA